MIAARMAALSATGHPALSGDPAGDPGRVICAALLIDVIVVACYDRFRARLKTVGGWCRTCTCTCTCVSGRRRRRCDGDGPSRTTAGQQTPAGTIGATWTSKAMKTTDYHREGVTLALLVEDHDVIFVIFVARCNVMLVVAHAREFLPAEFFLVCSWPFL